MTSKSSAQNTLQFIPGETPQVSISIRHSESTSSCRMAVAFGKTAQFTQFIFRHHQFRRSTVQANNKLWEYPYGRLVNVFESGRPDTHLPDEHLLVH
jgi:hypothetical protein